MPLSGLALRFNAHLHVRSGWISALRSSGWQRICYDFSGGLPDGLNYYSSED